MGRSGDPRKRAQAYGSDNPREAGGEIVGDTSDPYARNSVAIYTQNAILLDGATVSIIEQASDNSEMIAMALTGRINRKSKRSSILYVFDEDGAAAIITELSTLAHRAGWGNRLKAAVDRRQATLKAFSPLGPRSDLTDALSPLDNPLGGVRRPPAQPE